MSKLQDVAARAGGTEAAEGGAPEPPVRLSTGRPMWRLLGKPGTQPAVDPAETDDERTSRFSDGLPFTMSLD